MGVATTLWTAETAHAGSARDYLNALVDTWLLNYNAGYTTSVTPEDGTGHDSRRSRQRVRSIGRPYAHHGLLGPHRRLLARSALCAHRHQRGPFRASTNGVSDVGFLWQMNIFGGPALTREQFQSFIPKRSRAFICW